MLYLFPSGNFIKLERLSGNVHPSRDYDKDLHNRICREEFFGEVFQ